MAILPPGFMNRDAAMLNQRPGAPNQAQLQQALAQQQVMGQTRDEARMHQAVVADQQRMTEAQAQAAQVPLLAKAALLSSIAPEDLPKIAPHSMNMVSLGQRVQSAYPDIPLEQALQIHLGMA